MQPQKLLDKIEKEYCGKLKAFSNILLKYNETFNLTSVCDEKGVLYKHFFDSIAGEEFFPLNANVAEIGSGGGFPSVPLKIVRDDLSFTLIESTGKKCAYLKDVVEKLAFSCVQVRNIRAEDGARDKNLRERFDVSCARAVARLNTLCEYCLPFVRVGGRFIAYKSDAAGELKEAERAVKLLGGEVESVTDYELPEGFGKRNIVCIRKIKPTPEAYPRGRGRERKNPL